VLSDRMPARCLTECPPKVLILYLCCNSLQTADAENSFGSHSGQGTRDYKVWPIPETKVLLMDCAGSTSSDIAHSLAALADVMIVVLGDSNRAEQLHGDIMLWAWRMRSTTKVIFVLTKFDQIFKEQRSSK
jgi:hypothetical protein